MTQIKFPHEIYGVKGVLELAPPFEASLGFSHSVYCPWRIRGKGIGRIAHEIRLRYAKYVGFKYLLCSVQISNAPQLKIMSKFKWDYLSKFGTYCNEVLLFGKDLHDIVELSKEEVITFGLPTEQLFLKEKEQDK